MVGLRLTRSRLLVSSTKIDTDSVSILLIETAVMLFRGRLSFWGIRELDGQVIDDDFDSVAMVGFMNQNTPSPTERIGAEILALSMRQAKTHSQRESLDDYCTNDEC